MLQVPTNKGFSQCICTTDVLLSNSTFFLFQWSSHSTSLQAREEASFAYLDGHLVYIGKIDNIEIHSFIHTP